MNRDQSPREFYDYYKTTHDNLMDMLFCMNSNADAFSHHFIVKMLSPANLPLSKFWAQADIMNVVVQIVALIENPDTLNELQQVWTETLTEDSALGAATADTLAAIATNPHVTETTCLSLLDSLCPAVREAVRDNTNVSARLRTLAAL